MAEACARLHRLMVVSTTLTGSNATIIADALTSVVGQVDRCLVIDTGARDDTLDIARRAVGHKLLVRTLAWKDDFAAARNFALQAATEAGAQWAITVDTDERLHFDPGFDLRSALADAGGTNVFLVSDSLGSYAKERVVRVPATVRWTGPTHEMLDGQRAGESRRLPGVHFSELDKDAEALKRKSQRDVAVLKRYTRQHPKAPRWFYYLGDAHQALGEHAAAIEAYRACAALGGWAEEGAWACYRAAQCCCELKRWPDAIHLCAAGLAIRPATAELAWLAGYAAYHARRYDDAIAWSNMAIANGAADGAAARFERVGFRHLPGLHEGPYDVLRWTYKALGDAANEAEAARRFERARSERGGDAAKGSSPRAS